ncbi:MAG: radical SAM protein, partial [Acidobacteriota bacterium]
MLSMPRLYQLLTHTYAAIPEHLFRRGYSFPPLRVAFILTHRCNLKCQFCLVWSSYQKERKKGIKRQELGLEEVKGVIDQLPGYSVITFTGGEPFLRKELMEIVRYSTNKHRCHIVTNGTLCREDEIEEITARRVSSILGKGVLSVGISIEA